jgi:XTP/dITP diphosphohydrolase
LDLIVLATRNEGKTRELSILLQKMAGRVESLREHPGIELPPETGSTYRENALAKARAVFDALRLPALGDDSGLEVDALGGAPGLYSARFAAPGASDGANLERLLRELADVPPERRTARFRCALALVRGSAHAIVVEGVCEGTILDAPRGLSGFGYDPIFVPEGEVLTFAELADERKNALSHRGRAAVALRNALGPKEG